NLQTAVASRAVLGEIRAQQGRADEADVLITEAIEIAERTDIILDHAIALRSAARIAALRGDDGEAERYRAASELLLADKGVTGLAAVRASAGGDATKTDAAEQPLDAMRSNAAADVMKGIVQAQSREDLAAARGRFHPDFVARFRSRVFFDDTDLDGFVDNMAGGVLDMDGAFETEVIALRADDVAMGRFRIVIGSDVSDRLAVGRLDDGLIRELVFFDADQLREAYDELDRQWVEFAGGNGDWLTRSRAVLEAIESGDDVAIRSQLDDGFVSVDHRPLGLGTRTTDDFVETFRSDSNGVTVIRSFQLVEPIEVGEGGGLTWMRFTYSDGSTGEMLSVNQLRDGRMHRQEIFPVDRLDDARRCYDELTNPVASVGGRTVSNDASRAFEAWAAAVNDGDLDRYVALLHPGFVRRQHQRLQVQESIGAADDLEVLRAVIAGGGSVTTEVLAVRGNDIALGRSVMTFGADVVEMIVVLELDATGLVVSSETFEPEDLHDALDRLDAIHVEHSGPSAFLDVAGRMRRATAVGDWHGVRSCLAPGWTFHDRRPLGLGMLDREEYIRSSVRADHAYIVMEIIEDTGSVVLTHDRWVAPNGSQWEHLAVMTHPAGLSESIELFALDDLRAAQTRFTDLVAGSPDPVPELTNRAWEITQLVYVDPEPEFYTGLHHEDFVSVDHERFTLEPGRQ
ncbi:MAG TPA: tetratricopeptide repeat protein, partial [Ilumatobacteraceae bacterium]|nr:tetratricopeptide repeat protein [Ilumatobacteraceae bacterium]